MKLLIMKLSRRKIVVVVLAVVVLVTINSFFGGTLDTHIDKRLDEPSSSFLHKSRDGENASYVRGSPRDVVGPRLSFEKAKQPSSFFLHNESRDGENASSVRGSQRDIIVTPPQHEVVRPRDGENASYVRGSQPDIAVRPPLNVVRPLPLSFEKAKQFLDDQKKKYKKSGHLQWWTMRSLGYLYTRQKILLTALLPDNPRPGRNLIKIYNVYDDDDDEKNVNRNDCHRLAIWVRVNGPEIFAGNAVPVSSNEAQQSACYWEFPFDLKVDGQYQVHVKVVVWGNDVVSTGKCDAFPMSVEEKQALMHSNATLGEIIPFRVDDFVHTGFKGFKMYMPDESCCEICSRLAPFCKYWIAPALNLEKVTRGNTGCELFFEKLTPQDIIPRSQFMSVNNNASSKYPGLDSPQAVHHGQPHDLTRPYFVGCGWSNWFALDFPCLSGNDDHVHMERQVFNYTTSTARDGKVNDVHDLNETTTTTTARLMPLCTRESEARVDDPYHPRGRWVREPWPDATECPQEFSWDPKFAGRFPVTKHDGEHPHCWNRDDFRGVGEKCMEMNCLLIDDASKWRSPLHEESKWFGVWRNYGCDYLEFTDEELQQCITKRKIGAIQTDGASIAHFLSEYLGLRLKNMTMYGGSDPDTLKVTLSTLTLLHKKVATVEELRDELRTMPDVGQNEEFYWITAPYLSSERDTNIYLGRLEAWSRAAPGILDEKGYKMLDFFDMSAAFTYDTATQFDGLHITGPPMKMVITKLFHHMCADVVEGRTV